MTGSNERRKKTLGDYLVPGLCGLLGIVITFLSNGVLNALKDLTTEVRTLSMHMAVIETNQQYDKEYRVRNDKKIENLEEQYKYIVDHGIPPYKASRR
jgi:hypothetical protein